MEGLILLVGVLILFLCLIATIAFLLSYLGLTGSVEVSVGKPVVKNLWIAYKPHKGPYNKCGHHFTEAVSILPGKTCIGVFYDDIDKTKSDDLRYVVGVILAEGKANPPLDLVTLMKNNQFQVIEFPEIDFAVKSQFPNHLDLCAWIGSWKVYPGIKHYIQSRKLSAYPLMEIYKENVIHYMAPLSKQNDFFVSEFKFSKSPSSTDGDSTQNDTTDEDTLSTSSFEELNAPE
uniref:Testis-expressed sequence 264 protein-like n=1 Tax=Phallusia mammillata TaxID=59560 RepID=A0A6F9DV78_9ASCI|nr:testis-expressed sequence 264 protein-like [Phallusia mammillata]